MNLEQFIETSLRQIVGGVRKAQEAVHIDDKSLPQTGVINPQVNVAADDAPKGKYITTFQNHLVHFVDFDVAVTTDSTTEAKGGLSIQVAGFGGIGGGGSAADRDTVVSRIKFQIPIVLPRAT